MDIPEGPAQQSSSEQGASDVNSDSESSRRGVAGGRDELDLEPPASGSDGDGEEGEGGDEDYVPGAASPAVGNTSGELDSIDDSEEYMYVWRIPNWETSVRTLPERYHSEPWSAGDYKCRCLLFPRGNQKLEWISIYVEVLDIPAEGVWGQFRFEVLPTRGGARRVERRADYLFRAGESDRGFSQFVKTEQLRLGYIGEDGSLEIRTHIKLSEERPEDATYAPPRFVAPYDSKQATGFVGLKNQGATCYMNSLLQFMFHIPRLREAVYNMPTEGGKEGIALALQRVFYRLQTSAKSVDTKALTRSFGWNSVDAFMQHDVQEFNRVLCDSLEEKMKGTKVDGLIAQLFKGKVENFIECINVKYQSTRIEEYYDLSLMVKGCRDLKESFRQYVEVETLEGDNQYRAGEHGMQDARKGCRFRSLPPAMLIHLRRFEYDALQNAMVKLHDRFEFPTQIDLSEFVSGSAAAAAAEPGGGERGAGGAAGRGPVERNGDADDDNADEIKDVATGLNRADAVAGIGDNLYLLHSVLVHSGSVHGGHYYAFVRPGPRLLTDAEPQQGEDGRPVYPDDGKWYRFDDELVERVTKTHAVDKNFGGAETRFGLTRRPRMRASSAYMLVYINYKETLYHPGLSDLVLESVKRMAVERQVEQDLEAEMRAAVKRRAVDAADDRVEDSKKSAARGGEATMDVDGNDTTVPLLEGKTPETKALVARPVPVRVQPQQHPQQLQPGYKGEPPGDEDRTPPREPPQAPVRRVVGQPEQLVGGGQDAQQETPMRRPAGETKDAPPAALPLRSGDDEGKEGKERAVAVVAVPGEKRKREGGQVIDMSKELRRRKRKALEKFELASERDSNEGADIGVPQHLVDRFRREDEEQRKREDEARKEHLYHRVWFLCDGPAMRGVKLGTELDRFVEIEGERYPYSVDGNGQDSDGGGGSDPQQDGDGPQDAKQKQVRGEGDDGRVEAAQGQGAMVVDENDNDPAPPTVVLKRNFEEPLKVLKTDTLEDLRARVVEFAGFDPLAQLEFWNYTNRENKTYRPNRIVPGHKVRGENTFDPAVDQYSTYHYTSLRKRRKRKIFFVRERLPSDAEADPDLLEAAQQVGATEGDAAQPLDSTPPPNKAGILVLFKYFDIEAQALSYVGSGVFGKNTSFAQLEPVLRERAGLPENTPLRVYEEECTFRGQINPCVPESSLAKMHLVSGDIICFQVEPNGAAGPGERQPNQATAPNAAASGAALAGDSKEPPLPTIPSRFDDVKEYLEYLNMRTEVNFRDVNEPEGGKGAFKLELLSSFSHADVCRHVAEYLGCGRYNVRLYPAKSEWQNPTPYPHDTMENIVVAPATSMYYEKLSYSVLELRDNKLFKIRWMGPGLELRQVEVLAPLDGKVVDLRRRAVKAARAALPAEFTQLPEPDDKSDDAALCRVSYVNSSIITTCLRDIVDLNMLPRAEASGFNSSSAVAYYLCETIPPEEMQMKPGDRKVQVISFNTVLGSSATFPNDVIDHNEEGYVPFHCVLRKGESGKELHARLAQKIKDKRLGTFTLKRVDFKTRRISDLVPINDDDVLSEQDWSEANYVIGMHFNSLPRVQTRRSIYDRPITISAT